MKKKKGFTLIEVIAVLVILSIIFLIATPLVMNIIRKSKIAADKRSIDVYGRTIEIAAVAYMLDDTKFPTNFDDLTIEYTGSNVECAVNIVNMDGSVFLDKCAVNGKLIKDSKYASGYYQFGRDTNSYMLTKYKDINEIVNNTATGNTGSNVNNSTANTVSYNGGIYYRLTGISVGNGYEVLISEKPLTYDEVIGYNLDIPISNQNGYAVVAYYTSDTCNESDSSGCKTDYASSNVKLIIDAWANKNLINGDATIMTTSYLTGVGYAVVGTNAYQKTSTTPKYLFEMGIDYWAIDGNGNVYKGSDTFNVTYPYLMAAIRPIVIAKTSDIKPNKTNNGLNPSTNGVTNNTKNPLTVDNIIMYVSIAVIVICGIIFVIYMLARNSNDKNKDNKKEE